MLMRPTTPTGKTLNQLPGKGGRSQRKRSLSRRAGYWFGAHVIHLSLRILWATYRIEVVHEEESEPRIETQRPVVLCFWHEQLVCGGWFARHGIFKKGVPCGTLISPSVDGDMGAYAVQLLGGNVVRGSGTRSGVRALRGLISLVKDLGSSVMLVVDGPRGPARKLKPGAIALSRMTGAPILPLAFASKRPLFLTSWDRTRIPKPFSRVTVLVGPAIHVPTELADDRIETERLALEAELNRLTDSAAERAQA